MKQQLSLISEQLDFFTEGLSWVFSAPGKLTPAVSVPGPPVEGMFRRLVVHCTHGINMSMMRT